jgi:tripartite-type tricarboxylate transporter receptor subunit TctC
VELLKLMTKTDIVHIPYRGTPGALTDLAGGRVDMLIISQNSSRPLREAGKAKLLAIAAPQRSSQIPDVPTTAEAGLPGYEVSSWFGLFAPAGTPQAVIDLLSSEVKKAAVDPRFVSAMTQQGMEIVASSPEETKEAVAATSKKWGDVIRATGVTLN